MITRYDTAFEIVFEKDWSFGNAKSRGSMLHVKADVKCLPRSLPVLSGLLQVISAKKIENTESISDGAVRTVTNNRPTIKKGTMTCQLPSG